MIRVLDPQAEDIICISALPPYAFAPARLMYQQVRGRFPAIRVVVRVWGFSGDTEKAKARFERKPPDRLVTSLAQALEQIEGLANPERSGSGMEPVYTLAEANARTTAALPRVDVDGPDDPAS
jgi:hypothetical protein